MDHKNTKTDLSRSKKAGKYSTPTTGATNRNFPWQEKLVAPLIENLIVYSQCKDRVTTSEGRRKLKAT